MPRNPYERDDDLDIPDFIEDRNNSDNSNSIDMSIFKMSDDELYDDYDNNSSNSDYRNDYHNDYDDYDDYDNDDYKVKPKKKKANTPLIVCMIIIFLLLIISIASIFYALKQHESYVKTKTEFLQLQANEDAYKTQLQQKDAQITALNAEIEQLKSAGSSSSEGSLVYIVTDGPISFRNKPSRNADNVTYNNNEYAYNNEKFNVIEVVKGEDDPDYQWAKLKDNVYFCLGTSSEVWAKKVD